MNFLFLKTLFLVLSLALITSTVKPAHTVTSIKQSHVLKGHLFLVLS